MDDNFRETVPVSNETVQVTIEKPFEISIGGYSVMKEVTIYPSSNSGIGIGYHLQAAAPAKNNSRQLYDVQCSRGNGSEENPYFIFGSSTDMEAMDHIAHIQAYITNKTCFYKSELPVNGQFLFSVSLDS